MNPPFHFYPKPNVAIAIPVKTWWSRIFRNRTHYVALPLNTKDDYVKIQIIPELRVSKNILHLDFRVEFNEFGQDKKLEDNKKQCDNEKPKVEFLQYVCLKITHIPSNLSLVQLKVNKIKKDENTDHFSEIKLDPFFDYKKYDAHFKFIKDKEPLKNIYTRQGIIKFENSVMEQRDFDSCTIPPK